MRLAAQRPLLPALQGMLLCAPLRSRGASARPLFGFHVCLSRVSAYMVRRAVSARVEDHVRGDAKFFGGVHASDHPTDHGGDGLPLPQYPHIQTESTGRSLPKGGSTGRVTIDRARSRSLLAHGALESATADRSATSSSACCPSVSLDAGRDERTHARTRYLRCLR